MLHVSNSFKNEMANDNRKFLSYLDITLADGSKLDTIDNSKLWNNGVKVTDGVTASDEFTIGSCIVNKLSITLNNIYDEYSLYDFSGAEVSYQVGLELENGNTEKIQKGIFTVNEPKYNGSIITLECYDNMYKLDKDYEDVKTSYPATIGEIVRDICSYCGVTLLTTTFDNDDYVVEKRPDTEALTCRQVMVYCMQIACKYARCDVYGRIKIDWFDQATLEYSDMIEGGNFEDQKGEEGFINLLQDSGESVYSSERFIRGFYVENLKPSTNYTLIMNGKILSKTSRISVYDYSTKVCYGNFSYGQDGVEKITFKTPETLNDNYIRFWSLLNSDVSVVRWACLYEGYVKAPMRWIPSTGEDQYELSDCADGGNFDYDTGDNIDAGTFEDAEKFHHLYSYFSIDIFTDDVVITGISVSEVTEETNSEEQEKYLYGKQGYVLEISGNPFIYEGKAEEVATYIGQKLVGLRFRPLSGQFLSDPTIEAGDIAYITDRKSRTYKCIVTNLTFSPRNYVNISCDAKAPVRNSAKKYSELTKNIVNQRRDTKKQISDYDKTVQEMTKLISNGFGMYFSAVEQDDGSKKFYMHNAPTIEQSSYTVTATDTGIIASTDGGTSWAIDYNGNALFNVLSVVGFYFDWARGGTIHLGGYNNINGHLEVLDDEGSMITEIGVGGIENRKGYEYIRINESILTGGYDETVDGLLDLSAQYEDGSRKTVLESITNELVLRAHINGVRIQVGDEFKGYAVGSKDSSVSDKIDYIYVTRTGSDYYVGFTPTTGTTRFCILTTSDKKLKKNIKISTVNALSIIDRIEHKSFELREGGGHKDCGFIAQDLQKINSTFVVECPEKDKAGKITGKTLQVNDFAILPYVTKAIQELHNENKNLKKEIKELKSKIESVVDFIGYSEQKRKLQ